MVNNTHNVYSFGANAGSMFEDWDSTRGMYYTLYRSHVDGKALDVRYLRTDRSGGRVLIGDPAVDIDRNRRFIESLRKYGFTVFLSDHSKGEKHIIPGTTHYKGHTDHLHIGGLYKGRVRYAPKVVEYDRRKGTVLFMNFKTIIR